MIEQNQNTEEILMDTVLAKLDRQDEKSQLQEKRISVIESKLSSKLNAEKQKQSKLADGNVQELNKRLDNVLAVFSKPPQSEVRHHHHFPAILLATAGLFLALCLVSIGWFMTGQKAEQFKAGDFKYRHLKLFTDSASSAYLFRLDSLYEVNPDSFKNAIIQQERLKQERLQLLDQIHSVDDQIGGIQDKAGEKKKSKN